MNQEQIEHKEIPLSPVTSSQIESVGYDAESQTLAVKFKHSGTYHYPNFPAEKHAEFLAAESIGKYFQINIKYLPFIKLPVEQKAA